MLPEMTYPGDTSLSDEIRERILTTFEQALDLAGAGSHREALLGCDFVLRLDPLFEPARVLHKRLSAGGDQIRVDDLRGGQRPADGARSPEPGASTRPGRVATPPARPPGPAARKPASAPTAETTDTPARNPAATVFQRVTDAARRPSVKPPEERAEPPALGDVELDSGRPDPAGSASSGSETGRYETGRFDARSLRMESPDDETLAVDPLADTIFAEKPQAPTGSPRRRPAAFDAGGTAEPAPLGFEEIEPDEASPTAEVTGAIELESLLEEQPDDPLESTPLPVDSELVTTFLNTPVEAEPMDESILGGLDPVSDMAEPLGAPAQLDDESQRRIEELLEEGQSAYDVGEYQSAIDSWSRVFLIDIDHSEANRRIERARRMAAEAERQVEEVFHEAISHLDAGDGDAARESLHRVLELQPGHLAAHELLGRIESGEALPSPPRVDETGPTTPAGFDLHDSYTAEEGSEDLFAAPDIVPAAAELTVTPLPGPPARAKRPRQTFLFVGSLVLLLVIAGGWYLMSRWESLFPNSDISQVAPAPQRIDPIARAKKLHEQGKTAIAIAQLRRLPPGDPHYAEGQALVAQWETAETESEPAGPSEAERQRHQELVARARQAHAQKEYLLAEMLLTRAAAIAPLDDGSLALKAEADRALEPLAEQIQVFRSGDWEYALPTLWRMREESVANADINRLIIDSYYNLGVRDLQRGRPDLALRKFEEALALRPEDPTLQRLQAFAVTYQDRDEDLLYRIFVKYLPFR
jgi:tetratricopeptide (TPR) repeat protein